MAHDDLFDKFKVIAIQNYRRFCILKNSRHYFRLLKKHGIERKKLTREQKKSIDSVWGGCGRYDYNTHILAYSVTGTFDPKIVPESLFRTKIELLLNNQSFKYAWADKAYFNLHFTKELFPKTITCNINGTYYDEDYNVLTEDEAIKVIDNYDEYVIKPSLDSGVGKGIELCRKDMGTKEILKSHNKNFVVQELFKQHKMISEFNPSSVNVIRYISLFINGRVIPIMGALRCGAEGAFNDNSISDDGLGMFVIGIDKNGKLKDKAYHSCGKSITKCPNGSEFAGKVIPGYDKIKDIVKDIHSKLGYFRFIGWDFIIDEEGNPKIMEYNLKSPGILYYQYANGPILGEYTREIIDWIIKVESEK